MLNHSPASRRLFLASATFLAVMCPWVATAGSEPALTNAVGHARAIVQEEFAPKVPGVSVAVAVDGKIVWSEGFGFRDLAAKKPVTPATRFRVGSVSKSLTSAGLVLLVERGRIDLDAPVQKYVPDFPVREAPISTRLLGGHLAGIRHYRDNEMLRDEPFADSHAALTIFKDDPLVVRPGTKYSYSTCRLTRRATICYSGRAMRRPGANAFHFRSNSAWLSIC
jgi:CubicO group peptidase (beta-lactamase class C family)